MGWLLELLRRLQFRVRRRRFDADMAEEMQLHLDLRAAERLATGLSSTEAEAAARRQFGNVSLLQESSREAWGWTFLDRLRQDVTYAFRALGAHPAFTATAVLSLALGIGANTAIFSIINAVMLRSLPVEDPQALVQIKIGTGGDDELNTPIWQEIRDRQNALSGVLAYASERFNFGEGSEVQHVQGMFVSGDFFRVLGVPAILGRTFTPADDRWGGGQDGAVAVISHKFWKTQLNGEENTIGKTVRLNGRTFTITGVTPPWFSGLDVDRSYDIAIPIGSQGMLRPDAKESEERFHWWLRVLGRLHSGDTLKVAEDRMHGIAQQLMPDGAQARFVLSPAGGGFSQTRVQYRSALFALMALAGLVLLIACANIANLLSARGAARQRELSVRMAIGATRRRVIRQLMTESLLLAGVGALGGFLLATWGSRMLVRMISTSRNPLDIPVAPDWRVLAFTSGAAVLTAILFGLAPSLRSTRPRINAMLKEGHGGTLGLSTRMNSAKVLLTGQIAISMSLLVGAALFAGTLRNLLSVDAGFDRRNVLLMSVDLPQSTTPQQRRDIYRDILDRVRSVPGVASAAHSVLTPISPQGWAMPTHPEGYVAKSPRDTVLFLNEVSAGYFRTMRTPVLLGREFNDRDSLTSQKVIVINESAAHAFFGDSSPIGRSIGMDRMEKGGGRDFYQIVGVVKDSKYNRLNEQPRRMAYLAAEQDVEPGASLRFCILSDRRADALISSLRSSVSTRGDEVALDFHTLEAQVAESLLQPRLVAILSAIFGGLALLLAMVGLYGAMTYSVTRRKSEIGIRVAMGAQRGSVVWLIVRDALILLCVGIVLGSASSVALGRFAASLLFGVQPTAVAPIAIAASTLALGALIAAYLPAWRAARLDPMTTLREE